MQWTRWYVKLTDRPKGQDSGFLRSRRIQASTGAGKARFRGPPKDPLNGPIAGLVEGDTFFSDPLFRSTRIFF